jgi:hypothetical protein
VETEGDLLARILAVRGTIRTRQRFSAGAPEHEACLQLVATTFEQLFLIPTIKNGSRDVQLINIYENERKNLKKKRRRQNSALAGWLAPSLYTEADFDVNETFPTTCSCLKLPAIDIPATPESL